MSSSQQPQSLNAEATLSSLPPEWPTDLTETIAARVAAPSSSFSSDRDDDDDDHHQQKTIIVVLDDDPTGTQTVHDLPVLTEWSEETLHAEFARNTPAFYIMTNSRSFAPERAAEANDTIARRLKGVAKRHGRRLSVISRSDSTLRGHYPLEIDVLARALQDHDDDEIAGEVASSSMIDGQIIIPFFLEGGRFTINNVHYVADGTELIPAADTPFANDAAFGFTKSNLSEYVEEKTRGRYPRDTVESITIDDVRLGGPDAVRSKLSKLSGMRPCIVNAVTLRDAQVFALGLLDAEEKDGKRLLVRSAASFVQARIGLPKKPILSASVILNNNNNGNNDSKNGDTNDEDNRNGGLVVVGSYVPKTTKQLESLLKLEGLETIEFDVADLVGDTAGTRDGDASSTSDAILERVQKAIASGKNAVLYTSRTLVTGSSPAESLSIGNAVSRALVSVVSNLEVRPRFIVAKGGITSSDVATEGLGIRRAVVLGQACPGVPVWTIGEEGKFPGMSYVVFPGNVGGDDALRDLVERLSE
mmetsp:Transcript_34642/g.74920  ORF Transcript_34642/g.74920 Transcript_34642/m.74920 type:complete len:531 (+) Transcript_34642:1-1593(+)